MAFSALTSYNNPMISEQELQQLVESISLESFGRPFLHQAKINRRLKTTGGRYQLSDHHLEFNPLFLKEENLHYLPGIIKHELVHYHLHLAGLGYQHKDRDFKLLLKKVGGSRYAPRLEKSKSSRWHYRCRQCGQDYWRQRQVNVKKYFCGRCRGKLEKIAGPLAK